MNWNDEEIDKLFQESASQLNVPYQDSFWEEMEALLPAAPKSRRGIAWIWGGFMTCILLIGTLFIPFKKIESPSLGRVANNKQLPGTLAYTAQRSANTSLLATETKPASSPAGQHTNSLPVSTTASAAYIPQADAKTTVLPAKDGNRQSAQPVATPANISLNPNSPVALSNPVEQTVTTTTETAIITTPIESGDVAVATEATTGTTEAASPSESTAIVERLPVLPVQTFQVSGAEAALLPTAFNLQEKNRHLYIQLGAGIAQSYVSSANQSAMMPTLAFGAGYVYDPKGWGCSAGLNFQSTFPANLEITQRSQIYGFGVTTHQQNLRYTQLYTVELPLNIQYRKGRHVFSAGVAPTFLAGTLMNLSRSENEQEQANVWYLGKKEGLKSWGLKPMLAYQLRVNQTTLIGMQLNVQTMSQIDPQQFSGKPASLPVSGQITIRRILSK